MYDLQARHTATYILGCKQEWITNSYSINSFKYGCKETTHALILTLAVTIGKEGGGSAVKTLVGLSLIPLTYNKQLCRA